MLPPIAQLTAKSLLTMALLQAAASFVVELITGRFHPELPHYQFTGLSTADHQAFGCAVVVLSAVVLIQSARRDLPLYAGLIALGLLGLLLTKSLEVTLPFLLILIVAAARYRFRRRFVAKPRAEWAASPLVTTTAGASSFARGQL